MLLVEREKGLGREKKGGRGRREGSDAWRWACTGVSDTPNRRVLSGISGYKRASMISSK